MSAYEVACVALLDASGGDAEAHGAQQVVRARGIVVHQRQGGDIRVCVAGAAPRPPLPPSSPHLAVVPLVVSYPSSTPCRVGERPGRTPRSQLLEECRNQTRRGGGGGGGGGEGGAAGRGVGVSGGASAR